MVKQSKQFLIYAESCTEAEARMVDWVPSNYQDAVVTDVKKTNIGELRLKGDSETFWLIKIMDDLDGTADKAKPYLVIYDGEHLEDAVRKASADWGGSEMENVTKFKQIVDDDLISEVLVTTKSKAASSKTAMQVLKEDTEDGLYDDDTE